MINLIGDFLASFTFAETTQRTYHLVLLRCVSQCNLQTLTASGLIEFLKNQNWGNSRQCVALAAIQKFIRWHYGSSHPALTAKLKRVPSKPQRSLDPTQALTLLASFNRFSAKGARDLAIATLAIDTGLRESELCRLQLANVDLDRRTLQVIVKGGQWAAAVFSNQTAAHISHWLAFRKTVNGPGFLFTNISSGQGLKPQGLQSIVKQWGIKCGFKLSPHDLRRSFAVLATDLMGAPERVLMEGGRWHNSEMIHRYTRTLKLEAMRRYLPISKLMEND